MPLPLILPALAILTLVGLFWGVADPPTPSEPDPTYVIVDVIAVTTEAVAAWQVQVDCPDPEALLVGVENGDADAFPDAPHHDPAALQGRRIILADYSTAARESLPRGRIRLATLHVERPAGMRPGLTVSDPLFATHDGARIQASVTLEIRP